MVEKFENMLFAQNNQAEILITFVKNNGNKALDSLISSLKNLKHEIREVESIHDDLTKINGTKFIKRNKYIFYYNEDKDKTFAGLIKILTDIKRRKT